MTNITGWNTDQDLKMLNIVAELMFTPPTHLLDDLVQKTGETIRMLDLEKGGELPMGIRNELRQLYNKHMNEQEYIKEKCIETSKGIIPFMLKWILGIGAFMMLLAALFG